MSNYIAEPFRIKMVERLNKSSRAERAEAIKKANYNMFALPSKAVYIDLLTDSGTNAMSDDQWAGMMIGDESYAGADSYFKLRDTVRDIFACRYVQPVHQGRAAEKILYPCLLKEGQYSVANTHFDTTRGHINLCKAKPVDLVDETAHETETVHPFKGNMDCERLRKFIVDKGAENIGVIVMTITNNSAGGQPVSMANMREVSEIAGEYGIVLTIDGARFAENAMFIKEREEGYAEHSILDITREMFGYADCFTMSAKKDGIVNMGGLIGVRDDQDLFTKIQALTVPYEGFLTYGGLAGRDLEALAIGLYEAIDEDYLAYRLGQIRYLGDKLRAGGVPIQYPTGGHAVFVDARKILPQIAYYQFPGQALVIEAYLEGGIRGCDIGSFMLDLDPETGEQLEAELEFARFCIPRRVYTQAHLDHIAKTLITVSEKAHSLKGYRIVWQTQVLRHFTARLEPLE